MISQFAKALSQYLEMLEGEGPNSVGRQDIFLNQSDLNDSVRFNAFLRPVHVTFFLRGEQR